MAGFWKAFFKFYNPASAEKMINKIFIVVWLAAIIALNFIYIFLSQWPWLESAFVFILIILSGFVIVILIYVCVWQPLSEWLGKRHKNFSHKWW